MGWQAVYFCYVRSAEAGGDQSPLTAGKGSGPTVQSGPRLGEK